MQNAVGNMQQNNNMNLDQQMPLNVAGGMSGMTSNQPMPMDLNRPAQPNTNAANPIVGPGDNLSHLDRLQRD